MHNKCVREIHLFIREQITASDHADGTRRRPGWMEIARNIQYCIRARFNILHAVTRTVVPIDAADYTTGARG